MIFPNDILQRYLYQLGSDLKLLDPKALRKAQALIERTIREEGTVYVCGNGGSMAVALHMATDFAKGLGVCCHALGSNAPLLTALGNDEGQARTFAGELEPLLTDRDCVVAFSVSGASPNIVEVLRLSVAHGARVVLVRGYETPDGIENFDTWAVIKVAAPTYEAAEDAFAAIAHAWKLALMEELR